MSRIVRPGAVSFAKGGEDTRPGGSRPRPGDTDPDPPWLSYGQQQILDRLRAAVLARTGVLFLTGDVGTGKTFLARTLVHRLRADAVIAAPMYARDDPQEFWREVGGAWGIQGVPNTLAAVHDGLTALLDSGAAGNKRALLVIDEAQGLSGDVLADIGRLAVMAGEPRSPARLSILLVGQDQLGPVLSRPENTELAKRVGARYVTEPFTAAEVHEYVARQLARGGRQSAVFTDDGLRAVAFSSQGIPRLINTIVDLALLSSGREATPIDAEVVRGCVHRLGRPSGHVERARPPRANRPTGRERPRRASRAWLYVSALALLMALAVYVYRVGWPRDATQDGNKSGRPAATLVPTPPVGSESAPAEPGGSAPAAPGSSEGAVQRRVSPPPSAPALPPPAVATRASQPGPAGTVAPGPPEGAAPRPVDPPPPARLATPPTVSTHATESGRSPAAAPGPPDASIQRPVSPPASAPRPAAPAVATPPSEPGPSVAATPGPSVGSMPPAPVPPAPVRPLPRPPGEVSTARSENPSGASPAARPQMGALSASTGGRPAPEVRARQESERDDPGSIIDWLLSEYPARRQ